MESPGRQASERACERLLELGSQRWEDPLSVALPLCWDPGLCQKTTVSCTRMPTSSCSLSFHSLPMWQCSCSCCNVLGCFMTVTSLPSTKPRSKGFLKLFLLECCITAAREGQSTGRNGGACKKRSFRPLWALAFWDSPTLCNSCLLFTLPHLACLLFFLFFSVVFTLLNFPFLLPCTFNLLGTPFKKHV